MARGAKKGLGDFLTSKKLESLTDPRSYKRGLAYAEEGRVGDVFEDEQSGSIVAQVLGTWPYYVRIEAHNGRLGYACSCPVGTDGWFCKHCVAVAHIWLTRHSTDVISGRLFREYLAGLDREVLVDMVMKQVLVDGELRDRIRLEVARAAGEDSPEFQRTQVQLILADHYADADDPEYPLGGFSRGSEDLQQVLVLLPRLLAAGHADDVAGFAETALDLLTQTYTTGSDNIARHAAACAELAGIHAEALQKIGTDPLALARHLLDWDLNNGAMSPEPIFSHYLQILGEPGLREYCREFIRECEDRSSTGYGWRRMGAASLRYRNDHVFSNIADHLTRATNDPNPIIAAEFGLWRSGELSEEEYIRIIEIYDEWGATEKAAEAARTAFEAERDPDNTLFYDLLMTRFRSAGEKERMTELALRRFLKFPYPDTYLELKRVAEAANTWQETRRVTLKEIDARCSAGGNYSSAIHFRVLDGSVDEAWTMAIDHGCNDQVWLILAEARRATHPEDAMTIYSEMLNEILTEGKSPRYPEAIDLLDHIHMTMKKMGAERDFAPFINELRNEQKRKRKFIELLNKRYPER